MSFRVLTSRRAGAFSRREALLLTSAVAGAGAAGLALAHVARAPRATHWLTVDARERGLDPDALGALQARLADFRTRAFVIVRGDALVHEAYDWSLRHLARDPSIETRTTASMAKAVIGTTALLLLLGSGTVGLDEPASRYVPAWAGHPVKSRVTLGELASHTSGLDDATLPGDETAEDPLEPWEDRFWNDPSSRIRLSIERAPMRFAPGERVLYSNPGYEVLSYALAAALRASGQGHLDSLLRERIMEPLGLAPHAWSISYGDAYEMDGLRLFEIGGGAKFGPRSLARIGQLYLDGGRWHRWQLIDREVLKTALRPAQVELPRGWQAARHPLPALGWWSNANGVWRSAPRDTLVGAGRGHQLLIVIPSLDLVAVRFGRRLGQDGWHGDYWIAFEERLLAPLLAAVRD